MFQSARMGSPSGGMFRTNIGTKSDVFIKLRYLPNRVPDETKNLVDSVFDVDTGTLLNLIGILKMVLVVPMLILGILLISINSAEMAFDAKEFKDSNPLNSSQFGIFQISDDGVTRQEENATSRKKAMIGNESIAPVWTGMMLAASAATDFIAAWRRRGSTIILYMLVSTVTFVVSILCIEYDRLEIIAISAYYEEKKHWLKYRLYLGCVVLAAIGVAVGVLSIYVGSRMGALEESRLYMEREGKKAVLKKIDKFGWIAHMVCFARKLNSNQLSNIHPSVHPDNSMEENNILAPAEEQNVKDDTSNLVLAPQHLYQGNDVTAEQRQLGNISGRSSVENINELPNK